jgi:hypothetical protein
MEPSRKPLDSIVAKKRAMYRRRYELLDDTFRRIDSVLSASYSKRSDVPDRRTTVESPAAITLRNDH